MCFWISTPFTNKEASFPECSNTTWCQEALSTKVYLSKMKITGSAPSEGFTRKHKLWLCYKSITSLWNVRTKAISQSYKSIHSTKSKLRTCLLWSHPKRFTNQIQNEFHSSTFLINAVCKQWLVIIMCKIRKNIIDEKRNTLKR